MLQDAKEGVGLAVVNVIELVGTSEKSWDDAVKTAIQEAQRTVRNISGVEVKNWTADVRDGRLVDYKANIHLAFKVEPDRA